MLAGRKVLPFSFNTRALTCVTVFLESIGTPKLNREYPQHRSRSFPPLSDKPPTHTRPRHGCVPERNTARERITEVRRTGLKFHFGTESVARSREEMRMRDANRERERETGSGVRARESLDAAGSDDW